MKKDKNPYIYSISELANEFGITPRTIRFYEEKGLLNAYRKTPTSDRKYGERDRARLKLILRGKRFGFSLSEIKELLDLYDTDPTQREQIRRTLELSERHFLELDEMIQELKAIRQEMLDFAWRFVGILESQESETDEELSSFMNELKARLKKYSADCER
ncbi:MAG: hypothetical protein A2W01_04215 [Candidatus Solincola sediminis]|nr:MAG: hypothetical protein A2W01_04215 [Candidatus Solincola sediminis]